MYEPSHIEDICRRAEEAYYRALRRTPATTAIEQRATTTRGAERVGRLRSCTGPEQRCGCP